MNNKILSSSNLRRILLILQMLVFYIVEWLMPPSLKFFSAFGAVATSIYHQLWIIPAACLAATFVKTSYRPAFFFLFTLTLIQNLLIACVLTVVFPVYYFNVRAFKDNQFITGLWLAILAVLTFSSIYYLHSSGALNWIWLLLHVSWALKFIAWTVTVRVYKDDFSFNEFIDFFFNPVFFFFTNDLNVLTPRKFLNSRVELSEFNKDKFYQAGRQAIIGLALLAGYGFLQQYYFLNLENLGIYGWPVFGSVVSIFTAILFHSANSFIQVSMLNAYSYELAVDMNRPWLAVSPSDYWKRMHFYVRDYIFEIITKPVLTKVIRWNVKIAHFRLFIIGLVYLVFTCTQIGYQPYRQGRTLVVGFLVTGVFVAMMALPEVILTKRTQQYLEKNHWLGRAMTFMILYVGYYFIFASRKGF